MKKKTHGVKEAPKMDCYLKAGSLGNGESPRYFLLGSVVGNTPEIIYGNKPPYEWLQAPQIIEEKEEYIMDKIDKFLWSAFKQSIKNSRIKFHERIKIAVEGNHEEIEGEYTAILYGAKTHLLYGFIEADFDTDDPFIAIKMQDKLELKVFFEELTQDVLEKTTHEKLERRILNSYPCK